MPTIKNFASLVKISHTVFAMPFAFIGYFLAQQQAESFRWELLLLVVLCMFFARNAAMSFNRYVDRLFDAANPRTALREIPRGVVQPKHALLFCLANALLFVATTFFINRLCLALSPVALALVLGYSYAKRFTAWCHFILGLGLSIAPVGAYIAVSGAFAAPPMLLAALVLLWSGGFDIIYALPDEEFDRQQRLHSVPAALGRKAALWLSAAVHLACFAIILYFGIYVINNAFYWTGAFIFAGCLVYQHKILSINDISKVNIAFAAVNGVASIIFAVFCILGLKILYGVA
ncbi:MAG: putative 4-hydroxybenzoate polyprenyltransferase [Prevotellaceae bacterium]|jgi:4-hydroxybenzoate polyprenyltransferase|nr:putative 4-hydroxybenzoate polyprenyltransferase [Prevotellaceae bacterium]